ncbi:MAG TPA: XRE family transcriptional regulator [Pseudonocardiaceae bacterium]|nr:XRE family transcriptional regulator [Pseudonocardiaceae bacterium]
MSNVDAQTLGGRIRDARKRAGVSQDELGRTIGLERTAVNKIEGGIRKVTALELSDIAAAIGVRMSTLLDETIPALVSHRSSQGLDTVDSQIDALLAKLASEVEFVGSLGGEQTMLGAGEDVRRSDLHPPSSNVAAEALAGQARALMDLEAEEPIGTLSNDVATIGLLAFSRDIGKDTADAGMISSPHCGVALVNSYMKVGRRRLALAHELGHYLIADDYTVDWRVSEYTDQDVPMESRIDRFARALLLPETALTREWPEMVERFGVRGAAIFLASKFRVDMATLAARLNDMRLVDGTVIASVRRSRTNKADIVEMGLYVPPEELEGTTVPLTFSRAVLRLVRDERVSRERALDLLQGTFDDADLPDIRERRHDEIWNFVS